MNGGINVVSSDANSSNIFGGMDQNRLLGDVGSAVDLAVRVLLGAGLGQALLGVKLDCSQTFLQLLLKFAK